MLNPGASTFYSKTATVVLMEPQPGICFDFQFGKCNKSDHHREDNSLALHICQLCVIHRQNFVDHSCSGGHTGHPDLCQNKKLGAVACPHQIQPTQIISHQETQRPNQNEFTDECATCEKCEMLDSYFKHLPAFECM